MVIRPRLRAQYLYRFLFSTSIIFTILQPHGIVHGTVNNDTIVIAIVIAIVIIGGKIKRVR